MVQSLEHYLYPIYGQTRPSSPHRLDGVLLNETNFTEDAIGSCARRSRRQGRGAALAVLAPILIVAKLDLGLSSKKS